MNIGRNFYLTGFLLLAWLILWLISSVVVLRMYGPSSGEPSDVNYVSIPDDNEYSGYRYVKDNSLAESEMRYRWERDLSPVDQAWVKVFEAAGVCESYIIKAGRGSYWDQYFIKGVSPVFITFLVRLITCTYFVSILLISLLLFWVLAKITVLLMNRKRRRVPDIGYIDYSLKRKPILSLCTCLIVVTSGFLVMQQGYFSSGQKRDISHYPLFDHVYLEVARPDQGDWKCYVAMWLTKRILGEEESVDIERVMDLADADDPSRDPSIRPMFLTEPKGRNTYYGIVTGLDTLPIALLCFIVLMALNRPRVLLNQCSCGYDLTGNVTGVCSECGKKVSVQFQTEGNEKDI